MPREFLKRFLLSATEIFLENKAVKLDFTLLFHMDEIGSRNTYLHTYFATGILFAESKLQKKHPTSTLCQCSRNQFFKYLDFSDIKIQHIHRTQQYSSTQLHNIFCPRHLQNVLLWQKASGDNVSAVEFCPILPAVLPICVCTNNVVNWSSQGN